MKTMIDVRKVLSDLCESDRDIKVRKLSVHGSNIYILFIAQLTDKMRLAEEVIKPILACEKKISAEILVDSVLYNEEIYTDTDEEGILDYVLSGKAVLLIEGESTYLIINTYKVQSRSVEMPELETTLRGSRDAFNENLETNLSLVRYRVRDEALSIDKFIVGRRTKTNIAVLHLKGVANEKFVNEIATKLKKIDIDGTIDSGDIQKLISEGGSTLFPQIGIVERSDIAANNLLEGKVLVLVDGNNLGLIAPKVFAEFFDSGDDHYSSPHLSVFSKLIRFAALFFALCLSSIYVSVIAFNSDILPTMYIVTIATARASVPFNAVIEAFLMEFTAEIMKEASIRLPKQIGPAIGIVGTIVIGQAAVSAGLVSPLMVIIVALGTMSSFVAPDFTIMSPIRILKFFLLILTGLFGVFGFAIGLLFIFTHLISLESFGIPYLVPASPLRLKDIWDYFVSDIIMDKTRPTYLKTNNLTRRK